MNTAYLCSESRLTGRRPSETSKTSPGFRLSIGAWLLILLAAWWLPGPAAWALIQWSQTVQLEEDFTVPAGETLVVQPGTTVTIAAGCHIFVSGTLQAVGTPTERIRFTRPEGESGRWKGIRLSNTTTDNLIAYADIDWAEDQAGSIGLSYSRLEVHHVGWSGSKRRLIFTNHSSLYVHDCVFPDRFGPDEAPGPDDDNIVEDIKGNDILAGGQVLIEANVFGTNKGHNDIIDFSGPTRPGPILEVVGNLFHGSGDECLDLGGDAHIEGNVFLHVHKDQYNNSTGQANAISTGDDEVEGVVTCIRNLFYDIDYVIDLKKDTYLYFVHNVVAKIPPDAADPVRQYSAINFVIPDREPPGKGAYLEHNIFWDIPRRIFSHVDEGEHGEPFATDLRMHYCLVPPGLAQTTVAARPGTIMDLGVGNLAGDPRFADPNNGDFHLRSQAGRWDPAGRGWRFDPVTSLGVDTGNPGTPPTSEGGDPDNVRINLGLYGGTDQASRSPAGWGLLADINNDGLVNLGDFRRLAAAWRDAGMELPADLDRDGRVLLPDLLKLANDWGRKTAWSPE
ncbi:MAG: hypothetical protein JW810_03040 [Sedimentisphaerales bacterium]|nr:hypothetical protein [Sedimentisphaerales bacterium]